METSTDKRATEPRRNSLRVTLLGYTALTLLLAVLVACVAPG